MLTLGEGQGIQNRVFKMVTPPLTEYKDVNVDTQVGISYTAHGNYSCGT